MSDLRETHIALVIKVNEATTNAQHREAELVLHGFRLACEKINGGRIGWMLMECDNYYLDRGETRDMCCGVFLDWRPA